MWKMVKLGDLCMVVTKGTTPTSIGFKFETQGINFVKVESLASDSTFIASKFAKINSECHESLKRSQLKEGDILFSIAGALGRTAIVTEDILPANTNQALAIVRLKENVEVDKRFLLYVLNSESTRKQSDLNKGGVAQQNLSLTQLKNYTVTLPPLAEQQHIVAKLDAAFAEIDNALNKVSSELESVDLIFNAFSNKFMEQNKGQLVSALIGDEFSLATGGTPNSKKKEYYEDGSIRWLVSGDIHLEEIFDCSGRITEQGYLNSNAKYLPINSVLIALNGQGKTRGTVALLKCKATCNQSLVSISPNDPQAITSDYLYFNLKNRYQEIRKITSDSGNDRRGLNMRLIKKINFQYPDDLNLQNEYVNKSKALILSVKEFQETIKKKSILLRRLKEAFLRQELKNNSFNVI